MWEAVAVPGRLADLEASARAAVEAATARAEASTDGQSRVVIMAWSENDPPALESAVAPSLYSRGHAWVFTRL